MLTDEQITILAADNVRRCGGSETVIEGLILQALELDAKPKPLRCPFCGSSITVKNFLDCIDEEWIHPEANCILGNMQNLTKDLWNMRANNG